MSVYFALRAEQSRSRGGALSVTWTKWTKWTSSRCGQSVLCPIVGHSCGSRAASINTMCTAQLVNVFHNPLHWLVLRMYNIWVKLPISSEKLTKWPRLASGLQMPRSLAFVSLRRNCVLHCAESQDCPVELKLCRATSPVYPVWQYAVCPGTCSIVRCLMYSVQHVHCAISGYSLSYCNVMYESDPGIVHCYRCTAAWLLCRNSDPMCSTLTGAQRSAELCIVRESTDCGVLDCGALEWKFYRELSCIEAPTVKLDRSATHNESAQAMALLVDTQSHIGCRGDLLAILVALQPTPVSGS